MKDSLSLAEVKGKRTSLVRDGSGPTSTPRSRCARLAGPTFPGSTVFTPATWNPYLSDHQEMEGRRSEGKGLGVDIGKSKH